MATKLRFLGARSVTHMGIRKEELLFDNPCVVVSRETFLRGDNRTKLVAIVDGKQLDCMVVPKRWQTMAALQLISTIEEHIDSRTEENTSED